MLFELETASALTFLQMFFCWKKLPHASLGFAFLYGVKGSCPKWAWHGKAQFTNACWPRERNGSFTSLQEGCLLAPFLVPHQCHLTHRDSDSVSFSEGGPHSVNPWGFRKVEYMALACLGDSAKVTDAGLSVEILKTVHESCKPLESSWQINCIFCFFGKMNTAISVQLFCLSRQWFVICFTLRYNDKICK